METKKAGLVRAAEVAQRARWYSQKLNPKSKYLGASMARAAGLSRTGVSLVRLPPKADSFAYHAHRYEEEWLYVLSGRAIALVDGQEIEIGPGDFIGFPTPSVAHNMRNPFNEEVVYLMGGENKDHDIIDYPELGKQYLLLPGHQAAFHPLGEPEHPFGRADPDTSKE